MIRRATNFADAWAVRELAERMHAESAFTHIPFDEDVLMQTLLGCINNPDDGVVLMAQNEDGVLKGFKFGVAHRFYFSTARVAHEMAMYVAPEFRGGFTCAALIKAFERWAKEVGALEVVIGVAANIDNDLTASVYERLGYAYRGPILKKVI